jgi:hypothetical protein
MVGTLQVLTDGATKETTVTLNAPAFATSVFSGAQIVIKEYATAKNAFNIEFQGSDKAVALFAKNAEGLMAALAQAGQNKFTINRLDTSVSDRPLFHRKEDKGDTGQQQQGQP